MFDKLDLIDRSLKKFIILVQYLQANIFENMQFKYLNAINLKKKNYVT